ncbi:peptidoglycan editing factor PgeF [Desulfoprunum benzoelyticum]|nr:peptidoglycan editing factor PgeF [Desulfoprunum benzoelyticum]
MFDRYGGVSGAPFSCLNGSYGVGDERTAVAANRARIKAALNLRHLVSARQVHGAAIHCLDSRPTADLEVDGVDALVTDLAEVGLMVQHADCQAVLLFDPQRRVIGAVHSGWRGSVLDILGKTVGLIVSRYRSRAEDLLAVVSPSLGPCCSEFVNHRRELPPHFQRFRTGDNHFDFWRISREQLVAAGLKPGSITVAGICTSCSRDYFSYRRACREGNGVTGRNCSVVVLGKGA